MKKFIKDIFLFILFFIPVYTLALYLFGRVMPSELRPNLFYNKSMYGTSKNMLTDLSNEDNIDVLIVGASDAYRGYDTRFFTENGFRVFNAGSSSQTPLQTFELLVDNIGRLNPKLVVYEVSPVCFELDGVESTTDLLLNGYSHKKALPLVFNNPEIHVINSYLFDLTDRNIVKRRINEFSSEKERYIFKGFVEMNLFYNKEFNLPARTWRPKSIQLNRFNDIIRFLKSKNIPYILTNAPSLTDASYSNKEEFNSLFQHSGNFLNGLNYKNFDSGNDFFDPSHLNQLGVNKWDSIVLEFMNKQRNN